MSAKKHLPGPWRWSEDSPARNGDYTLSLVAADGWGVLSCDGIENSPRDSDAALIAAAPDLLGLLKRGRRKLATYVSVYPGDKELRRLLADWDAAIAKAKGESA